MSTSVVDGTMPRFGSLPEILCRPVQMTTSDGGEKAAKEDLVVGENALYRRRISLDSSRPTSVCAALIAK